MIDLIPNALNYAKIFVTKILKPGSVVIDATVGNGNDTIFLAKMVTEQGRVYAFDIQEKAINNTRIKLDELGLKNVELILDGHQNMDKYVKEPLDAIMFNLGYLPQGDHEIKTKAKTTVEAVKKAVQLIKTGGLVTIVAYVGHNGGKEEKEELENFLFGLEQKQYNVFKGVYPNQNNNPPILFVIEKRN